MVTRIFSSQHRRGMTEQWLLEHSSGDLRIALVDLFDVECVT